MIYIDSYNKESLGLILESLLLEKKDALYKVEKKAEEVIALLKEKSLEINLLDDEQIEQVKDAFMENITEIFK
jgi:hypothetical protein